MENTTVTLHPFHAAQGLYSHFWNAVDALEPNDRVEMWEYVREMSADELRDAKAAQRKEARARKRAGIV